MTSKCTRKVLVGLLLLAVAGCGSENVVGTPPPPTATQPAPTVAPTAKPTVEPTTDTLGLVRAFFATLQAAIRAGTQADLVDSLGDATIERYGRDACATNLAATDPVPSQAFEVLGISGPGPWDYTTDGLTTTIPDAITVDADVTAPDATGTVATTRRDLHVQVVDGEVRWFTDCGTPLGAP